MRAGVIGTKSDTLSRYPATWISSNTAVASVTSDGMITPSAAGSAYITGTAAGFRDSIAVTVTDPLPAGSRFV